MKNKHTISYYLSHEINGFIQSYFAQFSHILVGKVSYQQLFSGIAGEIEDSREPQFITNKFSRRGVTIISSTSFQSPWELGMKTGNEGSSNSSRVKLIVVIPFFNTSNYVPSERCDDLWSSSRRNEKEKEPFAPLNSHSNDVSMEIKRRTHRSHFWGKNLALAIVRLINQLGTENDSYKKKGLTGLPKEVEVQYVELQYPYLDRTILAQYVSVNASKYNFTRMHKTVFRKAFSDFMMTLHSEPTNFLGEVWPSSPRRHSNHLGNLEWKQVTSHNENKVPVPIHSQSTWEHGNMETQKEKNTSATTLSSRSINHSSDQRSKCNMQENLIRLKGLKIELAGRLSTQRNIPRKTVNNRHTGSFNYNSHGSMNQYTSKNKIGAYNIKVWLS